jgi:hypothetical protein
VKCLLCVHGRERDRNVVSDSVEGGRGNGAGEGDGDGGRKGGEGEGGGGEGEREREEERGREGGRTERDGGGWGDAKGPIEPPVLYYIYI